MARLAQGATGFVGVLGREDGEFACAQHDGGNRFGGLEQAVIVRLVVGLDGFEALAVGELQELFAACHELDVEVVAMRFELLLASGDRIVLEHVRIDVVALNLIAAER